MFNKGPIRLSLKSRVYLLNAILLGITVMGAGTMIWYTHKTELLFKNILDKDIVIYQSAEALSTALLNQKGFASYYLLDRDTAWIEQFDQYKALIDENLIDVKALVEENWEKEALSKIESEYKNYIAKKNQVIKLYESGNRVQGEILHKDVRQHFSQIMDLCEKFKQFHKDGIVKKIEKTRHKSNQIRFVAILAIVIVIFVGFLINFIFERHILSPIRQLIQKADGTGSSKISGDEVFALKKSIDGLIEDSEQVHKELAHSRETLMQSEKMAQVGQLAAATAHSIRNPLTSVTMRLFSLSRSSRFSENQLEDFSVISEEIKQINKIVENFLEFSRPPKLKTKRMSPSNAVDRSIHLLEQRLKSYGVTTRLVREKPLQETLIDPEQMMEVIVNIIINACEAMDQGGEITIREEEKLSESSERFDVITITDEGPGIPDEVREKIFNPFFTTKDDGTGLGLSIAFNIIHGHGGWIEVSSSDAGGTSFIISLPVKEKQDENHTGY